MFFNVVRATFQITIWHVFILKNRLHSLRTFRVSQCVTLIRPFIFYSRRRTCNEDDTGIKVIREEKAQI